MLLLHEYNYKNVSSFGEIYLKVNKEATLSEDKKVLNTSKLAKINGHKIFIKKEMGYFMNYK